MTGWRTPEELIEIGFGRSRVVMANEFHNGMLRCVRTREVGRRLLPVAHDYGVRHLAMEALNLPLAEHLNRERQLQADMGNTYLGQPEMRALVEDALALGWSFIAYETEDTRSPFDPDGGVDWGLVVAREEDQARNLTERLPDGPLLVWCGNSHLEKEPHDKWVPMGWFFKTFSGIDHFALDQGMHDDAHAQSLREHLEPLGGTAGLLVEDAPEPFACRPVDALVFSLDNTLS